MAGVFLFDNDINLIASIEENKLIENYQESELGSSIIGYCSLPFHLFIEDSKYFGVKDDDNFFLYRIIKTVRKKNEISITGIHIFFDELNTRIVKDLRPKNKTASFILSEILKDTDWKVGLSDVDTLGSKSFYYQSCLSAFYEVIKLFDCEFKLRINFTNGKIVDKRVDLIKSIKLDYGRWFELGDKLLSVEAESNDGEVFTAFVGRGKGIEVTDENGNPTGGYSRKITFKDISWSKPNDPLNKPIGSERLVFDNMVNIYGYREAVVDFEDIEDPKKLLKKTYEYGLEHSRPRVQLKAKAVGEHVRLGEICTIINDKLKIRYKTRVFKLKIDHLCEDKIEFEFGDKIKTSVADRLSAQSEDLKKSKESIEKGLESFKRQVGNQIINSYFNEDGYNYEFKADNKYNLPAGLYSFDKPIEMNPTKVIYFGAGKIMIANRKTNDGNWDWSTFGTGDGFVADYITAGILQGGKVHWNLEDGTFLIGNSINDYSFYWDGSTLHMKDVDIDLTNNSVVKNMNQNIDKNNEDIKKANDVISQTQTSVQILKDSISSKVSKTEILSDKEIQNALKGRDGTDGANGSSFTWNMLLKSNVVVENDKYNISNYDLSGDFVVGEDYTLTIWGKLGEDRNRFDFYNSESYVRLEGATEIRQGVYSVSFKWKDTREYNGVVHKGDNSKLLVYAHPSSGKSTSRIDKIKLEKGTNANPVWSPHISETKGEKGDRGEQGIRGLQGKDGRDGIAGKDGVSSFTHIAYSNSADGSRDFSTSNSNREYIGIYVDSKKTDSEDYKSYKWSKIKGLDGKNGIAGKAGADGKTPYLHIAYSNSQDGSKDFSTTDSNRDYIGQYTDFLKADSTDYKKYSWSKIKGEFEGEIGGRNLIKNSDKITDWTKYDGGNHLITDEYMNEFNIQGQRIKSDAGNATDFIKTYVNFDVDDLVVGKNYTFSVYVKNNRDVTAGLRVNGFNWNFAYELQPNECKRFVVTGKREKMDGYWLKRFQLQLRSTNKGQFVDMTVARPQLEEGDVATSWKPNPSDLISETQTVKRTFEAYKEQTDRRLLSTVSQTDFNKNNVAIQKQFSSVDQKANGIISTVSSNYKDLSKKIDGKPSTTTVQSLISQKVDNVKIEVLDQISGVRSSISVMQDNIKLKADKTDLYGLVSFSDLKDSNSWTVINGENIKTGKISSADGSSWINLKNGNFSFYHNSLFIDENKYDWSSGTKRTRLHTTGTFRVSYNGYPQVELNSGGITLFKDNQSQDSYGTNKIQSNDSGNVQIGSIDGNGNISIQAVIGTTASAGFVMRTYGSLRVSGNLQVDNSIKYGGYGGSISKDKYY